MTPPTLREAPRWLVEDHDTYAVLVAPDGRKAARVHVISEAYEIARVLNGEQRSMLASTENCNTSAAGAVGGE